VYFGLIGDFQDFEKKLPVCQVFEKITKKDLKMHFKNFKSISLTLRSNASADDISSSS